MSFDAQRKIGFDKSEIGLGRFRRQQTQMIKQLCHVVRVERTARC